MTEREILEQSIQEHQEAIDKAKKELENLEATYSIGDRFFRWDAKKYILAVNGKYLQVVLIELATGECWSGVQRVSNYHKITTTEFRKICSTGTFTRYWDSQKKIYTGDKK